MFLLSSLFSVKSYAVSIYDTVVEYAPTLAVGSQAQCAGLPYNFSATTLDGIITELKTSVNNTSWHAEFDTARTSGSFFIVRAFGGATPTPSSTTSSIYVVWTTTPNAPLSWVAGEILLVPSWKSVQITSQKQFTGTGSCSILYAGSTAT